MQLKQKWILLRTQPYRIVDEKTGQVNEGISLNFLPTEDLTPIDEGTARGVKPSKDSIKPEKQSKIQSVPGLYEFTLNMKTNAQGKTELKVIDLDYVNEIKFA